MSEKVQKYEVATAMYLICITKTPYDRYDKAGTTLLNNITPMQYKKLFDRYEIIFKRKRLKNFCLRL